MVSVHTLFHLLKHTIDRRRTLALVFALNFGADYPRL
jgi:hypothetical protein